ncbi:MAG: sugar ABC transporter permease [Chloroflexi bacterium]|nr:sugar ABC transporter permease [Chloroflexota bacterium]MCL5952046.1 sugar ABC transporter permease [Chloroflexota bacterium]
MTRSVLLRLQPYLYLLPALIILALFNYYPILSLVDMSLHSQTPSRPEAVWVGLQNYLTLFQTPVFSEVLVNTAWYVLATVPFTMLLALVLAVLLNQKLRAMPLFRGLYYTPVIMPTVAAAALGLWMFNANNGLVNYLLHLLQVQGPAWLSSEQWALVTVMLIGIWKNIGYYMLIYLAGLQNIPANLLDAARLDGARAVDRFISILAPLLQPTTYFIAVVAIIQSFQVFDFVNLLTQGGPSNSTNVLVFFIYQNGFEYLDLGMAAAIAVVLFGLVLITSGILTWALNR